MPSSTLQGVVTKTRLLGKNLRFVDILVKSCTEVQATSLGASDEFNFLGNVLNLRFRRDNFPNEEDENSDDELPFPSWRSSIRVSDAITVTGALYKKDGIIRFDVCSWKLLNREPDEDVRVSRPLTLTKELTKIEKTLNLAPSEDQEITLESVPLCRNWVIRGICLASVGSRKDDFAAVNNKHDSDNDNNENDNDNNNDSNSNKRNIHDNSKICAFRHYVQNEAERIRVTRIKARHQQMVNQGVQELIVYNEDKYSPKDGLIIDNAKDNYHNDIGISNNKNKNDSDDDNDDNMNNNNVNTNTNTKDINNNYDGTNNHTNGSTKPFSDDHHGGKHSKTMRSSIFASWLIQHMTLETLLGGTILDIAGGKGQNCFQLLKLSESPVLRTVVIDPLERKTPIPKRQRKILRKVGCQENIPNFLITKFDNEFVASEVGLDLIKNSSCLLGMHSDQATGCIVQTAVRYQKPFAVVPCCVFSLDFPERKVKGTSKRVETLNEFTDWLLDLHPNMQVDYLPSLSGRNKVLYMLSHHYY